MRNYQHKGIDVVSDGAAASGDVSTPGNKQPPVNKNGVSPPWHKNDEAEPTIKEVISIDRQIKSVEAQLTALNRKTEYAQQDMGMKAFLEDSKKILQEQLAATRNSNQKLVIIEEDIVDFT